MSYNLSELMNNLEKKISNLGINPKFKENPAYKCALDSITGLVSKMDIPSIDKITVREENGHISFDYRDTLGAKYSLDISSSSPEIFNSVITKENVPYRDQNTGQMVKEKEVTEEVASFDENSGFITLNKNYASLNNSNCTNNQYNIFNSAERRYYTQDGVMMVRENKNYIFKVPSNIDFAQINGILQVPREAYNGGYSNAYSRYEALTRDRLDTARYSEIDKQKGTQYVATVQLNSEYGLQNMRVKNRINYESGDVILPLPKEEIEELIQREKNPKVAEGLRAYAIGRDTYSYIPEEGKNFISQGFTEVEEKAK